MFTPPDTIMNVAPVGQVEVAVVVEVADVADASTSPCSLRESRGLLFGPCGTRTRRFGGGSNQTVPTSPTGQLVARLVEMWMAPSIERPTEPGCASQSGALM